MLKRLFERFVSYHIYENGCGWNVHLHDVFLLFSPRLSEGRPFSASTHQSVWIRAPGEDTLTQQMSQTDTKMCSCEAGNLVKAVKPRWPSNCPTSCWRCRPHSRLALSSTLRWAEGCKYTWWLSHTRRFKNFPKRHGNDPFFRILDQHQWNLNCDCVLSISVNETCHY